MISISSFNIRVNYDVLLPLLDFWSVEFNTFIFPWGLLTPTLLDVAAIIGIPISRKPIHP